MTDAVLISVVAGGAACVVAIIPALINAHLSIMARKAAEKAEKTAAESKVIGIETATRIDGRMDELVELTRKTAHALGVLEEKERGEALAAAIKGAQAPTVVIAQPK